MAQTYQQELLRTARAVARLQTQRRKLKRQLKAVEKELAAERKNLKAIANRNVDPDTVPSRLFGGGVGHKWRTADQATRDQLAAEIVQEAGVEECGDQHNSGRICLKARGHEGDHQDGEAHWSNALLEEAK